MQKKEKTMKYMIDNSDLAVVGPMSYDGVFRAKKGAGKRSAKNKWM